MTNKESVDKDLREYLAKADNLRNEDKLNYLRTLFDKHFVFTKLEHLITRNEFSNIVSQAKTVYSNQSLRPHISGRRLDQTELPHVAMIESFISYLNRNDLTKRQVSFQYTEEPNFESTED